MRKKLTEEERSERNIRLEQEKTSLFSKFEGVNKICSVCKKEKPSLEFNLHSKKYPLILKPYCKICQKDYDEKYKRSYTGLITQMYKSLKSSTVSRGHKEVGFSKEEFTEWLGKNGYDLIHRYWEESGFDRFKRPSVDRLDDQRHYYLENIRLTTWFANDKKYKESVKIPLIVTNIRTKNKIECESLKEASVILGIHPRTVKKYADNGKLVKGLYKITYNKLKNLDYDTNN